MRCRGCGARGKGVDQVSTGPKANESQSLSLNGRSQGFQTTYPRNCKSRDRLPGFFASKGTERHYNFDRGYWCRLWVELVVYGDILEMRDADDDQWSRSALVLRPAPPSFIERKNGSIVVIGVAGDEITPFTPELASRIRHNSGLRTIYPDDGEDLKSLLLEIGLLELPERVWLRIPKLESPASYLADQRLLLAKEPPSGGIEGIRILDTSRSPAFYRDRWLDAGPRHEGIFVARRPQRYGSALWCLLELQGGVVRRFMDLHSRGDRIRPCDIAWRIQMAIDAEAGTPQSVRVRKGQQTSVLSFFSPVPSWAEPVSRCGV
jgi:hypothetical protein